MSLRNRQVTVLFSVLGQQQGALSYNGNLILVLPWSPYHINSFLLTKTPV